MGESYDAELEADELLDAPVGRVYHDDLKNALNRAYDAGREAGRRERDDALRALAGRWKRRTSGRGFKDAARELLDLLDREDT